MTENLEVPLIENKDSHSFVPDRVSHVFRRPLYPATKFSNKLQERKCRNSIRKNGSLPNVLEYLPPCNGKSSVSPQLIPPSSEISSAQSEALVSDFHSSLQYSTLNTKFANLRISSVSSPYRDECKMQSKLTENSSHLPVLEGSSHPDLQCISPHTIVMLLEGKYSHLYEKVYIIDCRFDYEYQGGHIRGAVNISTTQALAEMFWNDPQMIAMGHRICVVFHCEYSSHRAPNLYRHFRNMDRTMNQENYPHLSYPEVYLLEGGYRNFFQHFKEYCEPQNYVEMKDPNFTTQMKVAMSNHLKTLRRVRSRSCSVLNFFNRQNLTQSLPNILNFDTSPFRS